MRLSLRFLVPLLVALALFAYAAVPLVDTLTTRWFVRDLDMRSNLIANTVQEPLEDMIKTDSTDRILGFFHRLTSDERLFAVGLCLSESAAPIATTAFPSEIRCSALAPYLTVGEHLLRTAKGVVHVAVRPLTGVASPVDTIPTAAAGTPELVLVHDMSFIERRSEETRRYLFYSSRARRVSVALITVVIAQLSWRGWVAGLRALLRGEGMLRPSADGARAAADRARRAGAPARARASVPADRREPAALDAGHAARRAARRDARQRHHHRVQPRALHPRARTPTAFACSGPASGLVTALEPVMRACSGTWIAHGSGSADREMVDKQDRVAVPPDKPDYRCAASG